MGGQLRLLLICTSNLPQKFFSLTFSELDLNFTGAHDYLPTLQNAIGKLVAVFSHKYICHKFNKKLEEKLGEDHKLQVEITQITS